MLARILFTFTLLAPMACAGPALPIAKAPQTCVVLLHGLYRTGLSMKELEWDLTEAGYQVVNQSYPSLTYPIEELAVMAVEGGVGKCIRQGLAQINFVTHSLGGILLRQYTATTKVPGLKRVVMLGPPNQGSEAADYVHSLEFLRPLSPQAIEQLGTGAESVPLRLGPVDFELGIIAGTFNYKDFLPGLSDKPGDGTVLVTETVVPGMVDFLLLPVSHTLMMWDDTVIRQVIYFLRHGVFDRSGIE